MHVQRLFAPGAVPARSTVQADWHSRGGGLARLAAGPSPYCCCSVTAALDLILAGPHP